jgi:hypothetical protein
VNWPELEAEYYDPVEDDVKNGEGSTSPLVVVGDSSQP